ncbi:hypothetical protein [Fluviicola sp.]|uniref:hypothetical protein n=1 Tax=Fluviicola sp. TaxID=1917219 RepID=UPI003D2CA5D5
MKLSKSAYYGPLCVTILVIAYYIFYFSRETEVSPKNYKLFHVVATDNAWESTGKGSATCFNYDILNDVSIYKQQFHFQSKFQETKAASPLLIKKNIRKNDTLVIGVLQSDFEKVQAYSYNFIKDDFFSRELKVYWIKKKELLLRTPKNCLEEEGDNIEEWLIVFSFILVGAIGRIIYLITQKVKFFT